MAKKSEETASDYLVLLWSEVVRRRAFCDTGRNILRQRSRTLFFAIFAVFGWVLSKGSKFKFNFATGTLLSLVATAFVVLIILLILIERPSSIKDGDVDLSKIYEVIRRDETISKEHIAAAILGMNNSVIANEKFLAGQHALYLAMLWIGIVAVGLMLALRFIFVVA